MRAAPPACGLLRRCGKRQRMSQPCAALKSKWQRWWRMQGRSWRGRWRRPATLLCPRQVH